MDQMRMRIEEDYKVLSRFAEETKQSPSPRPRTKAAAAPARKVLNSTVRVPCSSSVDCAHKEAARAVGGTAPDKKGRSKSAG